MKPAATLNADPIVYRSGLRFGLYGLPFEEELEAHLATAAAAIEDQHGNPAKEHAAQESYCRRLADELAKDADPYETARRWWREVQDALRHPPVEAEAVTGRLAAIAAFGGISIGLYSHFDFRQWLLLAALVAALIFAAPALLTGCVAGFHAVAALVNAAWVFLTRFCIKVFLVLGIRKMRQLDLRKARADTASERRLSLTKANFLAGFRLGEEARKSAAERQQGVRK